MNLKPDEQLKLLDYLNGLHNSKVERFALWKLEPDGSLVFINDGPTNGDFSREKNEAETQIQKSVFNMDLKTRIKEAFIGFSGKQRVVGVAIRDQALIDEVLSAVKLVGKGNTKAIVSKKIIQ